MPFSCACTARTIARSIEIGGKGRVEIDFLQRRRRRMIQGINICPGSKCSWLYSRPNDVLGQKIFLRFSHFTNKKISMCVSVF